MHLDYTTIDRKALDAAVATGNCGLARYANTATFLAAHPGLRLSDSLGAACFMDAPGFPSYFIRSVYTRKGDSPDKGPAEVLDLGDLGCYVVESADWQLGDTWENRQAEKLALFLSIWSPLPLDHPRTQAWLYSCYAYFGRCWEDPRTGSKAAEKLRCPGKNRAGFTDPVEVGDVARALGIWEEGAAFDELEQQVNRLLYRPFTYAKEFYSDFAGLPVVDGLDPWQQDFKWGKGGAGDWWERYDSPVGCDHPGGAARRGWCQLCGYVYPQAAESSQNRC